MPTMIKHCKEHGDTEYILEGRGYYRCKKCRSKNVMKRRRKLKTILVEEFGNKCQVCGYDRCQEALHFHHIDPTTKKFGIGECGHTRSIEVLREEAKKCILLCSNCHAEVENGIIALSSNW